MPYDGSDFSKWCLDLERRLDPAARMSHFLCKRCIDPMFQ